MNSSRFYKVLWVAIFVALMLMVGFISESQAATGYAGGVPWQIGDIVVCFGNGTCNVLRIVNGSAVLLDQFSDGIGGAANRGVAINNTVHAVVTDNGGGGDSSVVVYSIASLNPNAPPPNSIAHTPVSTFTESGVTNNGNAQAVVVNNAGHIFIGNAGSGGGGATPSIVELNADGKTLASPSALPSNPFSMPSNCTDIKGNLLSMDLSKNGSSLYLTSNTGSYSGSTSNGGSIQKLTLSTNPLLATCTPFANFGSGVALNGIQDVPPSALAAVVGSCNGTMPCPPTRETILVVAEGFFDSDGDSGAEPNTIPDSTDDVNICTNTIGPSLVSCALLLDTGGPGLTASPWVAGNQYLSTGTKVLDANFHVQQVATPGTSGSYPSTPFHPAWSTTGGITVDNRVTWQDGGHCGGVGEPPCPIASWTMNTAYTPPQQITDSASHIQQVAVAGTSGPSQPTFNDGGLTTFDGLTWTDLGTSLLARYSFASVAPGVSTLQALSLDPLVSDCSGAGACSSVVPPPQVGNFWVADNGSADFYEVNFGTGVVNGPYSANANKAGAPGSPPDGSCGTCTPVTSIQGLHIYGAEGANQAGFTKLPATTPLGVNSSTTVNFPLPVSAADSNTLTVTLYNTAPSPSRPLALYGSYIDANSCFNDQTPPLFCTQTTSDATKRIVWKTDIPLASSGITALSNTETFAGKIKAPTGVTTSTDVFLDAFYDTTTSVGNADPTYQRPSVATVHDLLNANGQPEVDIGCSYISPVTKCFSGPTVAVKFTCTGLPGSSLQTFGQSPTTPWGPRLQIVQYGPPPLPANAPAPQCTGSAPNEANATQMSGSSTPVNLQPGDCATQLPSTNGAITYRYDPVKMQQVYNWAVGQVPPSSKGQTYRVCTYDDTHTYKPFCSDTFTAQNKCSK